MDDYLIRFANTLDPNLPSGPAWPQYSNDQPNLYTFTDDAAPSITQDTYRTEPIKKITELGLTYPR